MLRERPSPNHDARPKGQVIDILVLHYTGMRSAAEALDRLADPAAKVSAHYLIDEDGTVWAMVPEARRAWHAGVSSWAGATDINARSIGIELVNPGHEFGYRPFPAAQMEALLNLARGICARHPIPPQRVLGHSDVAPARKQDPGELFDWAWLARHGVGIWPEPGGAPASVGPSVGAAQELLAAIGYDVPRHGRMDEATQAVITAFQRHFLPTRVTGGLDGSTLARIEGVAAAFAR